MLNFDPDLVITSQSVKHAKPVEQTSKDDSLTECKLLRFCAEKGAAQNIKTAKIVCIRADTLILRPQLLTSLICNRDHALYKSFLGLQLERQVPKDG